MKFVFEFAYYFVFGAAKRIVYFISKIDTVTGCIICRGGIYCVWVGEMWFASDGYFYT